MTPGINKIKSKLNIRTLKFSEVLSLVLFCSPFYTIGEVHGNHSSLNQFPPPEENNSSLRSDYTNDDFGKAAISEGIHPVSNEHFDSTDKSHEKKIINGHGRYPHYQEDRNRPQDDIHPLQQNDIYDFPQSDQPLQDQFARKSFQFREEGRYPTETKALNKYPHSPNSMLNRREHPNFSFDKKYDHHQSKKGTREPYNYLSNNFVSRNYVPESRISSSNEDKENEIEFPDKIVKDGQVFYRHGANNFDSNHREEGGLLDKEQSDGKFKIFSEMSPEISDSGDENLSKGFDLLFNQVRKAQEKTPSISAAIAGAAIRGSSKGSYSHVIGSAINGGYFAASAKGYDDKGGSIHSHIQGTGNGAGGGASAIAPGREGEAFIQVDNSDNGLSIGQSSTHNGEAFVIADVDKNSQYHYEKGDNTSSFSDKYKNDSHGFSFGEAKSKLYPSDENNSNTDQFEYKNIPKYNPDSNNNNQRKPLGMGLIDNIMEKVHQPGVKGYNKDTLQTESSITESYGKLNFEGSPAISNEQIISPPKDKGAVGLVTFPFNTIGSPPGPGELLTQAPVTKIGRPNNHEENFENYYEELPYYDANNNEHNNDYYSDKDLKTKGNELNNKNFNNFGQNQNRQHTFESPKSPDEATLFNGDDKTSPEHFYNEANLVYQPFSSVLIDSHNNRHLLPPTHTPVNQNGVITNSYNEFPENKFNENDFNGFSNTLPKPEHQEPKAWKTITNTFVSKDTTDHKIRNSQEPILQRPQGPIEAPLDNNGFHSINSLSPSESWKDSNYPSVSKEPKDYNYPSIIKHTKDYNQPSVSYDAKEYNYSPLSKNTNNYNYPFVEKDTQYFNYPFAGKNANANGYNYSSVSKDAPDYKIRNSQGPIFLKPQVSVNTSSENDFHSMNPVTPSELLEKGNYPLFSDDTLYYNSLFVNKDTMDYKTRNLPGPILQAPQISTEVPFETNLHSTNLVTPILHSPNIPISNRNYEIDTNKYFNQQPKTVGNEFSIDHETPKTNYPLHNQNEKNNYDQGPNAPKANYPLYSHYPPQTSNGKRNYNPSSSFSNQNPQVIKTNYPLQNQDENGNYEPVSSFTHQDPQVPITNYHLHNENTKDNYSPGSSFSHQDPEAPMPFEENFDLNTSYMHMNYPLYNQNVPKDGYDKIIPISNQNQMPTISNMNEMAFQRPVSKTNFGSSNTILTTTERMQVITPGVAGQIQHLNASEPGYPNIRVLTINNNDERSQFYQREGTSIGPGERIPGAPGYKVPPGFRGRVVLGHQLPVNIESKKAVQGYNTKISLTPQRPYTGPVFASVSGPQAASKMNPNFGNGVQILLSSPTTKFSNLRQRPPGKPSVIIRKEKFNRKLSTPTSSYLRGKENINSSKRGKPEIIKNSNGQCGYYINECVRPPPFYRNYCTHRFINVACDS